MVKNKIIVIDTREQNPIWKNEGEIVKKLDTGDISILGYENKIAFERKSLSDLFQTLTWEHERFKKEVSRGLKLDYFAIIVEGRYSQMIEKIFTGAKHTKMPGQTIARILCTIHVKYGIPIFFTNGRDEAKQIINDVFDAFIKQEEKDERI